MRGALICLAAIVASAATMLGTPRAAADEYDLQIITPHYEHIRTEFERAFVAHVGRPLKIGWIMKGTGQIIQQLDAQDRAAKGRSFDIDVFFGGGVPDHDLAASKGYLESPKIPDAILAGIPKQIAGVANYDERHLWFGSAYSSFGVLMNRRGLASQKLPEIKEWKDLADPRMYGWLVIADPRKSSSVRVTYELVLQQHGWEQGWPLLMQIAANSRQITASSSDIPNEVATGNVLAGPCIDFYARARIEQAGEDVLAYVDPVGGSAVTPDPISMLRQPPHRELAEKFIAFVLSAEGQRLWVLPPGTPDGPQEFALRRLPVRPDVCAQYAGRMLVKDPYKEVEAGTFRRMDDNLQRARNKLLAELMGAALVDLHSDLREAWKALIDGGMKPAALAEWRKVPFSEKESLELSKKLEAGDREARELTREWTRLFKAKYQRVKELAK
jgi:ABC-type Fe3+ transport system substrate-binding protein